MTEDYKSTTETSKKVSESSVFIPFGSFSTDKEGPPPTNEVYVGREKERANFIRTLLNGGRSGAYLITGQRGTGKTSFVDHCLKEYNSYAFQRYIRGNSGKFLLDKLLAILTVLSMICFTFLFTEMINWDKTYGWHFNYILIVPLTLISFTILKKSTDTLNLISRFPKKKLRTDLKLVFGTRLALFTTTSLLIYLFIGHISQLFLSFIIQLICLSAAHDFWYTRTLIKIKAMDEIGAKYEYKFINKWGVGVSLISSLFVYISTIITTNTLIGISSNDNDWVSTILFTTSLLSLLLFYPKYRKHKVLKRKIKPNIEINNSLNDSEKHELESYEDAFISSNRNIKNSSLIVSIVSLIIVLYFLIKTLSISFYSSITFKYSTLYTDSIENLLSSQSNFNNLLLSSPITIIFIIALFNILIFTIAIFSLQVKDKKRNGDLNNYDDIKAYAVCLSKLDKIRVIREFQLLFLKSVIFSIFSSLIILNIIPIEETSYFLHENFVKSNIFVALISYINDLSRALDWSLWLNQLSDTISHFLFSNVVSTDLVGAIKEHRDLNFNTIVCISLLIGIIVFFEYEWVIRQLRSVTEEEALHKWIPDSTYEIPDLFHRDSKILAKQYIKKYWKNRNKIITKGEHRNRDSEEIVKILTSDIEKEKSKLKTTYSLMTENCIVNYFFKFWSPTLNIKINLGFDEIQHKTIVLNILEGLYQKYHALFYTFDNPRFILIKLLTIFIVAIFSIQISAALFDFRNQKLVLNIQSHNEPYTTNITALQNINNNELLRKTCQNLNTYTLTLSSPAYNFLSGNKITLKCDIKDKYYLSFTEISHFGVTTHKSTLFNFALTVLYFDLFSLDLKNDDMSTSARASDILLPSFVNPFDSNGNLRRLSLNKDTQGAEVSVLRISKVFKVYHILIFIFTYTLFRFINNYITLSPFRKNLKLIRKSINEIKSKNINKSSFSISGVLSKITSKNEESHETITEPVDARVVENQLVLAFEAIANDHVGFFGGFLSVPSPDITIVFDELDKLGSDVSILDKKAIASKDYHLNNESKRSEKIKALMSDLKAIVTSEYCKFVFIGGRHLYDEWLGDKTKRDQLMPSIFDRQFYLKTLLQHHKVSHEHDRKNSFSYFVRLYFAQQYKRSNEMFESLVLRKNNMEVFASESNKLPNSYASGGDINAESLRLFSDGKGIHIIHQDAIVSNDGILDARYHKTEFLTKFTNYLAFRSHGIPKRLVEILSNHILPMGTALNLSGTKLPMRQEFRLKNLECFRKVRNANDALFLEDIDIIKVQFIDFMFNQISDILENRLKERDDKIITSTFSISDYIFKFHNRAFTWESLEKIDDLVDINRAPDIRNLLFEYVDSLGEVIFHKILNGMYSYRFKSHISCELNYISKYSADESAAFNFTLDESQALKRIYFQKLEDGRAGNPEIISYYAELFEFDQEYDAARKEYTRALNVMDSSVKEKLGGYISKDETSLDSVIPQLLTSNLPEGLFRHLVSWGTFRMRTLLQIGLTYELARNLEKAESVYMEALELSRTLLLQHSKSIRTYYSNRYDTDNYYTKHFHLLYQPIFAISWVAEKYNSAIDTSASILHTMIKFYDDTLPFKLEKVTSDTYSSVSPTNIKHSNFSLIKSELRNKAGDLFFFKGSQRTAPWKDNVVDDNARRHMDYGYLLNSHYHYAVGLQYLRQFNLYRYQTTGNKFSFAESMRTFQKNQFPEYLLLSIASGLSDMSEAALARIDFAKLVIDVAGDKNGNSTFRLPLNPKTNPLVSLNKKNLNKLNNEIHTTIEDWICHTDEELEDMDMRSSSNRMEFIKSWFGEVCAHKNRTLVGIDSQSSNIEKLNFYMSVNRLSSRYIRKAGYLENAAFELLMGLDTIDFVLKLTYMTLKDGGIKSAAVVAELPGWDYNKDDRKSLWQKLEDPQKKNVFHFVNYLLSKSISRLLTILGWYRIKKAKTIDYDALLELVPERYTTLFVSLVFHQYRFDQLMEEVDGLKIENFFCPESHREYIDGTGDPTQNVNYLVKVITSMSKRYILPDDFTRVIEGAIGSEYEADKRLCKLIFNFYTQNTKELTSSRVGKHPRQLKYDYERLVKDLINKTGFFKCDDETLTANKHSLIIFKLLDVLLKRHIEIHRYPILNRLNALVVLSDIEHSIIRNQIRFCIKDDTLSDWDRIKPVLPYVGFIFDMEKPLDNNVSEYLAKAFDINLSAVTAPDSESSEQAKKQATEIELSCIKSTLNKLYRVLSRVETYSNEIHDLNDKFDSSFHFIPVRPAFNYYHLAKLYLRVNQYLNQLEDIIKDLYKYYSGIDSTRQKKRFEDISREVKNIRNQICELKRENYQYSAGHHYSVRSTAEEWLDQSKEELYKSQQMYTMRRKYYESISEMYYLYDDFNDRHIHHGHALQMLSSETAYLVEKEINRLERKHLKEDEESINE